MSSEHSLNNSTKYTQKNDILWLDIQYLFCCLKCVLIDETEQSLKSMEDYKKAFQNSFKVTPQLKEYLKKYLVPLPGDWPTWFYTKKIPCVSKLTRTNSIPVPFSFCWPAHTFVFKTSNSKTITSTMFSTTWFSLSRLAHDPW